MRSPTSEPGGSGVDTASEHGPWAKLSFATVVAACVVVCVAEITMPTVLNGLFQSELHADGSEIASITDASLLPVTALTFGVLGDRFGRKRLLVIGAMLLVAGHIVTAAAPAARTAGAASTW